MRKRPRSAPRDPNLYFDVSGSTLIKTESNYAFFKSIFWWSGVVSQNTPKSNTNAFEKLVFGSDDFGAAPTEFDLALLRRRRMLDTCYVLKKGSGHDIQRHDVEHPAAAEG